MEEKNKDIVIDGQQETLLFQDVCTIIERGRQQARKVNTCVHNLEYIGQLDMYVRMYDDLVKGEDDQPTVGVLLCTDTDNTIARYSVLNDSDQLYAAKYMTYMPTEEELRREIEQQKEFYRLQHKEDKDDGR